MTIPYKQGLKQGIWTPETPGEYGWESTKDFLADQYAVIEAMKDGLTELHSQDAEVAEEIAKFTEGFEKSIRESEKKNGS